MSMALPLVLLFFIIVIFIIMLVFGSRIIKQNVNHATQHLDDISQDYMKKEEQAQKKLEEAENLYQETVNKAKEEALTMRQDILDGANQEKDKIVEKARAQSEEIIQQGEKTRHLLISEFEKRIEAESIKKASGLLAGVLPEEIRRQIHVGMVSEALDADLSNLGNVEIPKETKEVKVVSAFSLDEKEKKAISRTLKAKTGKNCSLNEEVDKNLTAGFMIVIGNLVLDASLQRKIRDKAQELVSKESE